MKPALRAHFEIAVWSDTHIILIDLDNGPSVTNDANAVIASLDNMTPGGIAPRRVYYLDTSGRFDELRVSAGAFAGFAPCSPAQQERLAAFVSGAD